MKFILAVLAMTSLTRAAEEKAGLAHIVTLGTRPYYLLDEMENGELKEKLGKSFRILTREAVAHPKILHALLCCAVR